MSGIEYKKGRITGTVKILPPPPAKTLPSSAELELAKMPGVPINYTSVNTYRNIPQPSMTNYALQIQLSKIADASVMKPSELNYKKAFQADGTTPEMLEAYKQLERADLYKQGIFRPNYDIDLIPLMDEENLQETVRREKESLDYEERAAKRRIQADYDAVQANITGLLRQKMSITAAYNRLVGEERAKAEEYYKEAMDQLDIALGASRRQLNTYNSQIGTIQTEKKQFLKQIEDAVAQYYEAKKANDATFRKYENDIRSLNQGFVVGRMVGESDEDYKNRLLTFERENVEAITQQEAAMYNNRVFKNNLKKVVRLPVHLEEELMKKLGQANLFSINEKWPLYEKKFIENYGKFPVMGERNSLVDFFTSIAVRPTPPPPKALVPPNVEVKAPSKGSIDPRFASSREVAQSREQLQASQPLLAYRDVGKSSSSERLRSAIEGSSQSAKRILQNFQYAKKGERTPLDFGGLSFFSRENPSFKNTDSLKQYILSKGGSYSSRDKRADLERIAANL